MVALLDTGISCLQIRFLSVRDYWYDISCSLAYRSMGCSGLWSANVNGYGIVHGWSLREITLLFTEHVDRNVEMLFMNPRCSGASPTPRRDMKWL